MFICLTKGKFYDIFIKEKIFYTNFLKNINRQGELCGIF